MYEHPDTIWPVKAKVTAGLFLLNDLMVTSKGADVLVWHTYRIVYHLDGETTKHPVSGVAERDLGTRTPYDPILD